MSRSGGGAGPVGSDSNHQAGLSRTSASARVLLTMAVVVGMLPSVAWGYLISPCYNASAVCAKAQYTGGPAGSKGGLCCVAAPVSDNGRFPWIWTRGCSAYIPGGGYETCASSVSFCFDDRYAAEFNDCFSCNYLTQYRTSPSNATAFGACAPLSNCSRSSYESTPNGLASDRVCSPVTVCTTATPFQLRAPTGTTDRVCTNTSTCATQAATYRSHSATPTTDVVCSAVTRCNVGETFETTAPTATTDRVCNLTTACRGSSTSLQVVGPSSTTNRVCGVPNCTSGATNMTQGLASWSTMYQTVAATATTTSACAPLTECPGIPGGMQITAPTYTTDRQCGDAGPCPFPSAYTSSKASATTTRTCAAVSPPCVVSGSCAGSTATPTSDRVCQLCNLPVPVVQSAHGLTASAQVGIAIAAVTIVAVLLGAAFRLGTQYGRVVHRPVLSTADTIEMDSSTVPIDDVMRRHRVYEDDIL